MFWFSSNVYHAHRARGSAFGVLKKAQKSGLNGFSNIASLRAKGGFYTWNCVSTKQCLYNFSSWNFLIQSSLVGSLCEKLATKFLGQVASHLAVILKCWAWRVAKTCCRFSRKLEIISEVKLSNCPFRWWSCFLSISLSQIWEKDAPFSVLKDSWPTIAPNRPAPCVLSE